MIEKIEKLTTRLLNFINRKHNGIQSARRIKRNTRPHNFAVLAIMKNEAMAIDEWITHYQWMGASKIFLIDNGSTDDTVKKAREWVSKGIVELIEYPERHRQRQHYWKAIKHFKIREKYEWLLIADLDEFWFCPGGESLSTALLDFQEYDVIYSNWVMFGSSGLLEQPESIRKEFTLRRPGIEQHRTKKFICRTPVLRGLKTIGIHQIYGVDSSRTVSDTVTFQLNHYPIQSLEFFQSVKMTRGGVSGVRSDSIRDMAYFERYDEGCDEVDTKLADLVSNQERST